MHIITTPIGIAQFEASKIADALKYVTYLRDNDIEYTHIFED
jgi:hypothetical protein